MHEKPSYCPDADCANHVLPKPGFFRKRGYFTAKCRGYALARYECKACGKTFSSRTNAADVGQHKPQANRPLAGMLCSGVTLRRSAILLGLTRKTVDRKAKWLAKQARAAHDLDLKSDEAKTDYIQFDEMQTFEHAAAKKLTIAVAIRFKTKKILSLKVGRVPSDGHLAAYGRSKYGWTVDESRATCLAALTQAAIAAKPVVTVACDGEPSYPGVIAAAMPAATVASAVGARSGFDPLYRLNHTCARLRADLACMARRTWTTTKQRLRLQDRLDIFVAFHNNYSFC